MSTKKELKHRIEMRTIKYTILRRCIDSQRCCLNKAEHRQYSVEELKKISSELECKTLQELSEIHNKYVGYPYLVKENK